MNAVNREPVSKPLTKAEITALAEEIRDLLANPDANLNSVTRTHWEGALSALETVLGLRSSLVDDDPALL